MKPELRPYDPRRDYLEIRNFLDRNYLAFPDPVNWDRVRWNYARCFVAPMLGAWGTGTEAIPEPDTTGGRSRQAVQSWESVIGVWEDGSGEIVGVVCPDEFVPWHPAYGQAFLQRHPGHENLLEEMLRYAEETFGHAGAVRLFIGATDEPLQRVAGARGFRRDPEPCLRYLEYDLGELPAPDLPEGYRFQSMADVDDVEKRREVQGRCFRHPDPRDWPTALSYRELQKAPDYRRELDLVVVDPQGEYVACAIAWFDDYNHLGTLEPVGSRRLGMGRQVVLEGLRRLALMGARRAHLDAGLKFYRKIGFRSRFPIYRWVKRFPATSESP